MEYTLARLSFERLIEPTARATASLTRLDERVSHSTVGQGWIERSHFFDAVASLWIDGDLVHLEDLVLHDAAMGVRAPTHELTIAHDILRTRRRILDNPPDWALSREGLARLCGNPDAHADAAADRPVESLPADLQDAMPDALSHELAQIDALIERSDAVLSGLLRPARNDPPSPQAATLIYHPDWDEDERLGEWLTVLRQTTEMPVALRAAIAIDAWNHLQVLQHAPWIGRLLAAGLLRKEGMTTCHLACINLGLKAVGREARTSPDRHARLAAILDAITAAGELGLKEHDRLVLAERQMQHRLIGRRQSSKLPQLVELALSRPMVSTGMVVKALSVTPQAAVKIIAELQLRELTGRGRFRAWGIL